MAPNPQPQKNGKFNTTGAAVVAAVAALGHAGIQRRARGPLLLPVNLTPIKPRTERDAARGSSDVRKQNRARRKRRGW